MRSSRGISVQLSATTSIKTTGRDSLSKQRQIHTLTCTWQIPSAGRKTTAHPHSPTGCTSDLRHGKSFSHSKEIFSLFFTFLCADLFSLSMVEVGKGWACSCVQDILHVYPSKSRHECTEQGLLWEHWETLPCHHGTWHRSRVA